MKPIEWLRYVSQSLSLYCLVDLPSIIRSPEVYLSTPPIMFKSVVLPHPDAPRIETSSFLRNFMLTPFNALTNPPATG